MAESIATFVEQHISLHRFSKHHRFVLSEISTYFKYAELSAYPDGEFAYFVWDESSPWHYMTISDNAIEIQQFISRSNIKTLHWDIFSPFSLDFAGLGQIIKDEFPEIYRKHGPEVIKCTIRRRI